MKAINPTNLVKRLFRFHWFGNLKIGTKLILSFVMVAMVAGLLGVIGTLNIYRISRDGYDVYRENV